MRFDVVAERISKVMFNLVNVSYIESLFSPSKNKGMIMMLYIVLPFVSLGAFGVLSYFGDAFNVPRLNQIEHVPLFFVLMIVVGIKWFSPVSLHERVLFSLLYIMILYFYMYEVISSRLSYPVMTYIKDAVLLVLYYYVLLYFIMLKDTAKLMVFAIYFSIIVRLLFFVLIIFGLLPGLYQSGDLFGGDRIDLINLNQYSYLAVVLIWLLLFDFGVKYSAVTKVLLYMLSFFVVVVGMSRAGWLSLFILLFVYMYSRKVFSNVYFLMAFSVTMFMLLSYSYEFIFELLRIGDISNDESIVNRINAYILSMGSFINDYGMGVGAKQVEMGSGYRVDGMLVHSSIVIIALSYGFLGVAILGGLMYVMCFGCGSVFKKQYAYPFIVSGVSIIALQLVLDPYLRVTNAAVFVLVYIAVSHGNLMFNNVNCKFAERC